MAKKRQILLVVCVACVSMSCFTYYFGLASTVRFELLSPYKIKAILLPDENSSLPRVHGLHTPANTSIVSMGKIKKIQSLSRTHSSTTKPTSRTRKRLITFLDMPQYYKITHGNKIMNNCEVSNCEINEDRKKVAESDIVIFYTQHTRYKTPPFPKGKGQIWIFYEVESPAYSDSSVLGTTPWRNAFNFTMTYRIDSEYKLDYGRILPRVNGTWRRPDYDSVLKLKTNSTPVALLISNCYTSSQRNKYIDKMKKFIAIDRYGKCGNIKCPKKENCREMIGKKYKFYLAFENSICKDYITEKAYAMLKYDIIPIVRGGANYSSLLPKNSVINTADFKSVKDLVDYIKFLDGNSTEYLKFFQWKKDYVVRGGFQFEFCRLCKDAHFPPQKKLYDNVQEWWEKGHCSQFKDEPLS